MAIKHIAFDTNTWVSFFYNAHFDKLVALTLQIGLKIYSCPKQLEEIKSVISRDKFAGKLRAPVQEYLDFCSRIAEVVEIDERFDRLADPKDNYLIDTAYTVKADHNISSDTHLLELKHLGSIQIISLSDFKKKLKLDYINKNFFKKRFGELKNSFYFR
jgi:putative PIN family toxin of toxin-antitoxin system